MSRYYRRLGKGVRMFSWPSRAAPIKIYTSHSRRRKWGKKKRNFFQNVFSGARRGKYD